MITIANVGSYVPKGRISNYDKIISYGLDESFIRQKIGVDSVSRKSSDEETSDLGMMAIKNLLTRDPVSLSDLDCLLVCTQNPDAQGLPHTSAIIHGKLDLPKSCACFDISLGCSGYVYSLSLMKSFMRDNGMRKGVIVTSDPYSKIIDDNDKNTAILFGDAATATLLIDAECGWEPTIFRFGTNGSMSEALQIRDGKLFMNGRAIFNFSATKIPPFIRDLLDSAGFKKDDIDVYLLHQGSKYILDFLIERLDVLAEKVPTNLLSHGNTVSSSIPLLLEDQMYRTDIRTMLLCGFGVGLSWAGCLVEYRP